MENNDNEREELLRLLQAQGQQFLQNFSLPSSFSVKRKREDERSVESDLEEWGGINDSDSNEELDQESDTDFEQEDDGFTAESSARSHQPVIVFSESFSRSTEKTLVSKAEMKTFMSSKISKLRSEPASMPSSEQRPQEADAEDERTNAQNDALLHKLVHTKLLSGSLDPDLNLTPAQRRKALSGRVLELTGKAKLGKGEHAIRTDEHNRASKRVREGIAEKKIERRTQELEDAKNLGNYHPTLKKLFDVSSARPPRQRDRGLKMGVGKFKGGFLTLSKEEINKAQGGGTMASRPSHRGRSGKRR